MNVRVNIIRETCEWFGVLASDITRLDLSDDPDLDRGEKMAWSLICHLLTSTSLQAEQMSTAEIATFFNVPVAKVLKGLNQREYWAINSGSYLIVKSKLEKLIDNYLIKIYG